MTAVLSIQSHVAYGHVGNSSAVFPLQRLGVEVWPVHTVQFSNHTGYGAWKGEAFSPANVRAVIDGIAERGVLGQCNALLLEHVVRFNISEAPDRYQQIGETIGLDMRGMNERKLPLVSALSLTPLVELKSGSFT